MGGGAATAKTASYVLVAADAGSTVAMNAAGATTITVNTALFAAGDTVFIQNLGAGLCTVTAGTATVSTAGSLILPQYDAGILYFTSASTAIFYDYIQTGATSPLTTKGDLYTFGTSDTRLGVGANGTTLVADSSEATGLKWATPASGGGMTLLSTTTLSGTTTTISSISGSYKELILVIQGVNLSSTNTLFVNPNGSTSNTVFVIVSTQLGGVFSDFTRIRTHTNITGGDTDNTFVLTFPQYASSSYVKTFYGSVGFQNGANNWGGTHGGTFYDTTAITSFDLSAAGSTFNGGQVLIYGVN
jgi:hypothetical protein